MKKLIILFIVSFIPSTNSLKAQGDTPYVGQIAYVAFNFAPKGWAECDGQLMQISQNTALFSLLGTQYGGDGKTTFALPDMRGRLVVNSGQGPGLSEYVQGEQFGIETETLTINEMPVHSHSINAVKGYGNNSAATGSLPSNTKALDKEYSTAGKDTTMSSSMIGKAGENQSHENRPPFLTLKCIIALQGVYPPRP